MAKLTFSRAFDIERLFYLGDWLGATEVATATKITLTLGTKKVILTGAFTVVAGKATAGTITGFQLDDHSTASPINEFKVTGLALSHANFLTAVADGDLGAVFGNGNDWMVGSGAADKVYGGAGNDLLEGGIGNDTIFGSTGNDTLSGGTGNDSLQGGSGHDTYAVDAVADRVVEAANGGTDIIFTSLNAYTLGNNLENLTATGIAAFTGTGNALNNVIVGNKGKDKLTGLDGNDTLRGGNGNDTLDGGNGNDFLVGDSGASAVTTVARGVSPTKANLPITLSMTTPDVVAPPVSGVPSTTVTGYINNATLGGAQFNLAFVLDVSGSMGSVFTGSNVGDINRDGALNEKVDAAIASFNALTAALQAAGLGNSVRIALIPFASTSDIRAVGTATSDSNGNGVADVIDAALLLDENGGGTDYATGLSNAVNFFNGSPKGDNFVFFISDGAPGSMNYANLLTQLRDPNGINATIRSLGIESGGPGTGSYYEVLDLLDDGLANRSAIDVKTPSSLTSSLLSSQVNITDIKQLEIYKNGVLVQTLLPSQLTQTPFGLKYSVTVPGLSTTASDKIEARLVLKDVAGSFISTSQYVSVGTLVSNDSLVGGIGNDTLDGGAGSDTLVGGVGNDLYHLESAGKTIVEKLNEGIDTIESTFSFSLAALPYVENLTLLGSTNINGTGNNASNRIEGNIGNNVLNGLGGNDSLIGGYGIDIASYANSAGPVIVNLATGTATATGKADKLTTIEGAWGSTHADTLLGDAGANIFRGLGGNDTIDGGGGLDKVDYSAATSAITAELWDKGSGYGTVTSANLGEGTDYIDYYYTEGVIGSAFADRITEDSGYALANWFDGQAGSDTLVGGGGNDTLIGGTGMDSLVGGDDFDTVDYSYATLAVTGSLAGTLKVGTGAADTDTLSGIEAVIGSRFADSITGSVANESLFGGAGNDTLNGGDGNDTLVGGIGSDSMVAGGGDDLIYVDAFTDKFTDTLGTDTVYFDIGSGIGSFALGNVEKAYVIGLAGISITGGASSNTIVGGAGNDTIGGGAGNVVDSLQGGAGIDTLSYASSTEVVTGALNDDIGGDNTDQFENLIGSGYSDTLEGDSNANSIDGGSGNDTIYGWSGNDTLKGGLGLDRLEGNYGFDLVRYDHLTSAVTINLTTGVATNTLGNDTLYEIEHIIGSAYNDLMQHTTLTSAGAGLSVGQSLNGGAGNDTIRGGGYSDTVVGGLGNDVLEGGTSSSYYDYVDYSASTAAVTVNLGTNSATGSAIGTDTLTGFEVVWGSRYNDQITGSGAQEDWLWGGLGADTMSGGVDAFTDVFMYNSVLESRGSTIDRLTNFVSAGSSSAVDKIQLEGIDADVSDAGIDSFSFIGAGAFSGVAGQLRYTKTASLTTVQADTNGDKVADMTITISGAHDLTTSNFLW